MVLLCACLSAQSAEKAKRRSPAPQSSAGAVTVPPLPERKPEDTAQAEMPEPDVWQPAEIEAAQARCTAILKTIDAVAVHEAPIKEGKCGAPAPIRVSQLGKAHPVKFDPPALMNCDMAAALSQWLENDVQPLAITHLGAPIAKVEIMTDYACRASTGRLHKQLSEHAFADAVDIGGFVTEKGRAIRVLDLWGKTRRDVVAEAEAAKAQAAKEAAAKQQSTAQAADKNKQPEPPKTAQGDSASGTSADKSASDKKRRAHATLKVAAAKLGGPKRETAASSALQGKLQDEKPQGDAPLAAPPPATPGARFLHEAHAAACQLFGTTLGPEANEDHRNHFHVDMAERKYKKICD
jgi:hypothetical protein